MEHCWFQFHFTDILASIALVELESVDAKIGHLRNLYCKYEDGLKGQIKIDTG